MGTLHLITLRVEFNTLFSHDTVQTSTKIDRFLTLPKFSRPASRKLTMVWSPGFRVNTGGIVKKDFQKTTFYVPDVVWTTNVFLDAVQVRPFFFAHESKPSCPLVDPQHDLLCSYHNNSESGVSEDGDGNFRDYPCNRKP